MSEDNDLKKCRICLENDNQNDIISPCLCDGSILYVHRKCLDYWRTENVNKKSSKYCDICQFKYVIENLIYDKKKILKYYLLIIRDFTLFILCFQPVIIFIAYRLENFEENENKTKILYPNSINGFIVHYFNACLRLLATSGFVVIIIGFILSLFDTNGVPAPMFDRGTTMEGVQHTCTFVGVLLGILLMTMFLLYRMKHHRNKLWLKQEANINIVKDFTGRRKDLELYKKIN